MQTIISIIVFILILGSIIIIHEFGHFMAAKYFNVYCSQFSIGFGPKIWSNQGKETEYEIRCIPFGGFVAMAGEDDQVDNEDLKDIPVERTLKGIKTYQKIIIFAAGVFMNFVLAIVVTLGVNLFAGQLAVDQCVVGGIPDDSPAIDSGLEVGDIISQVDVWETGESILIYSYSDLSLSPENLNLSSDTINVTITVLRDDEEVNLDMQMYYNESDGTYKVGFTQATRAMSISEAFTYTFTSLASMSVVIIQALGQLVVNFTGTVSQLSGPAGIYQITSEVTSTGQIEYIFSLLAMLSVNVGIFNLMPIPGLDGCQILYAVVEKIIGRELPQNLKVALQLVGLGLVLLLMVIVTYQDIVRMLT
ncbi:MAG: site-2 protease family protein [Erysipelotrichaceae bacterium]|nr:site-2 protease family protein [Erysipelotrichaceae bacterium]